MKIVKNENLIDGWEIVGKVTSQKEADELKEFLEERGFINYCKRSKDGESKTNLFYENHKKQHFFILKDCAMSVISHLEKEEYNVEIEKVREAKKPMTAAERKAKSRANAKKTGGDVLGGVTLTSKAADQLSALCFEWGMNKTEVINKLLEEQEQRQLL